MIARELDNDRGYPRPSVVTPNSRRTPPTLLEIMIAREGDTRVREELGYDLYRVPVKPPSEWYNRCKPPSEWYNR